MSDSDDAACMFAVLACSIGAGLIVYANFSLMTAIGAGLCVLGFLMFVMVLLFGLKG